MSDYALPTQPDSQSGPGPSSVPHRHPILPSPATATTSYLSPATFTTTTNGKRAAEPPKPEGASEEEKKKGKRRKVTHACLYCRRSHMTCDAGRPCQRCIKREIGHLCHDEPRAPGKTSEKPTPSARSTPTPSAAIPRAAALSTSSTASQPLPIAPAVAWPATSVTQGAFLYPPETLRNEFSVLTDFLDTLDERSFFNNASSNLVNPHLVAAPTAPFARPDQTTTNSITVNTGASAIADGLPTIIPKIEELDHVHQIPPSVVVSSEGTSPSDDATPSGVQVEDTIPVENILPSATKQERFLLTAADQASGTRDERLNRVIRSKYEAGLLKPYNYVTGYARLSRWMDRNVSQESKQAILRPISILRPKFRAVAQSLTDLDHVFIEEAFERLLLDYDRVFSAMGIPACLWRRTGEIYKGNREFAELVGVDEYMLRDGRLCIYELMAEDSAVNYWEKYGHVAFDTKQKAVLTSCVLRYKPSLSSPSPGGAVAGGQINEEGFINCCFSITIRRDSWGIPSMIVGNFIKC